MRRTDDYANFAELKRREAPDAYRIRRRIRNSPVLILAPHGGRIEPGTSQIGALVAGDTYNIYQFEGRKPPRQNRSLHVTSANFDEPTALRLAAKCRIVLGIHGCEGLRTIYVGGRDTALREALATALAPTGVRVKPYGHKYGAMHRLNICNRGSTGEGAQLEITPDLRRSRRWRERIAEIAREVIEHYLAAQNASAPG